MDRSLSVWLRLGVMLLAVTALGLAACNAPLLTQGDDLSSQEQALAGDEAAGEEEDDAFDPIDLSPGEGSSGASDDEAGSAAEGDESGGANSASSYACPPSPEPFDLYFDHKVQFDTGVLGTWDITTSGGIIVSIAEGVSGNSAQKVEGPASALTQAGAFVVGDFRRGAQHCTFEDDTEVLATVVSGTCEKGVITLYLIENWGDVDTQITCCNDEGDCSEGKFMWLLPVNEFKDLTFTPANAYSVTKPFAGGGGTLHWTLQPNIAPVPLPAP